MAYGFLRPHIAGTTEKVTMTIAVADVSYDPTGATPLLAFAKKGESAAQFSISGELVQASGVWAASWSIPDGATAALPPGPYHYQAFLEKAGSTRFIDSGPLIVGAKIE